MNYLGFEWHKLKSRKWILVLAGVTVLALPIVIRMLTNLSYLDEEISQGQFMESAAYGFITYSSFYIFLPLWIIVGIGIEFNNGHVNLVVFNTSYNSYFKSKFIYCLLISLAFCFLGAITIVIVQLSAPFDVESSLNFYGVFIFQSFFTFLSISLLAMFITFIARNIAIAFVTYFLLLFADGMTFMIVRKLYDNELFYLPFHITNILYVKGGDKTVDNYYNFFQEPDSRAIILPFFLIIILSITYWDFTRRELKLLSD